MNRLFFHLVVAFQVISLVDSAIPPEWVRRHILIYEMEVTPCSTDQLTPDPVTVNVNVTDINSPIVTPSSSGMYALEDLMLRGINVTFSQGVPTSYTFPSNCVNKVQNVRVIEYDLVRQRFQTILNRKKQNWEQSQFTEYSFRRVASCFCSGNTPKVINVRPERIEIYDEALNSFVENDGMPITAEELFTSAQQGIDDGLIQSLRVDYLELYPMPSVIRYVKQGGDANVNINVTDFQPMARTFSPPGTNNIVLYIVVPVVSVVIGVGIFMGIAFVVVFKKLPKWRKLRQLATQRPPAEGAVEFQDVASPTKPMERRGSAKPKPTTSGERLRIVSETARPAAKVPQPSFDDHDDGGSSDVELKTMKPKGDKTIL
eukprot:PhF_6_TR29407/c0_g1_i4/m.43435